MLLLFFISLALIVYLSLFPWEFAAWRHTGNPLWIVLNSWPRATSRRILLDFAANVAIYFPVGFFGYLALRRWLPRGLAALVVWLIGTGLSAGIEMCQVYTPHRVPSILDLISNSGGTVLGILLAMLLEHRLRAIGSRTGALSPRAAAALLIVGCFALYQIYPLMPQANLPAFVRKVRALASPATFSLLQMAVSLPDWAAAAALLNGALGRQGSPVFAVLLALAPARLVIVSRTFTLSDLVALPLAFVTRALLARAGRRQFPIVAALLTLTILWQGLNPFSSGMTAFSWVPFSALFTLPAVKTVFLLKAFRYGALIWLLRSSGWRLWTAAGGVFVMLALIEAAQLWAPGHTPEITDPLLAVLFGLLLWALERYRASPR